MKSVCMVFFNNLLRMALVSVFLVAMSFFGEGATCAASSGAIVQDLYYPGSNGGFEGAFTFLERAQVFPIAVDGYLNHIDVYVNRGSDSAGNLIWDVRQVINGEPAESNAFILASGVIPLNQTPLFPDLPGTTLDVSPSMIRVHPSDSLAITLRTDLDGIAWRVNFSGNPGAKFDRMMPNYTGGTGMWEPNTFFPSRAHGFATYIRTIPEPAAYVPAVSALTVVSVWRRARRIV